jgi:ATP-binding cassette subfamily B multidrug efflux pump
MSSEEEAAAKRRGPRPMPGPGRMMAGGPVEKSLNFKASGKRVLGLLRPERALLTVALTLAVVSVTLSVIGPKILGHATDLILAGVFGKSLTHGATQADAVANLRKSGHGGQADLLANMQHVRPGQGIDFSAVGGVLLWVLGIYLLAGLCGIFQARLMNRSLQRAVKRLRGNVEDKIARLPLSYFDQQPRGEVLSRVTNDIDNIGQTLQQTLSQILTSLLTIVGVLVMMFYISWLLALIALISVPASIIVAPGSASGPSRSSSPSGRPPAS